MANSTISINWKCIFLLPYVQTVTFPYSLRLKICAMLSLSRLQHIHKTIHWNFAALGLTTFIRWFESCVQCKIVNRRFGTVAFGLNRHKWNFCGVDIGVCFVGDITYLWLNYAKHASFASRNTITRNAINILYLRIASWVQGILCGSWKANLIMLDVHEASFFLTDGNKYCIWIAIRQSQHNANRHFSR